MNLLARLFVRFAPPSDDEIANAAMELSLEWGPNFGKPIQERLRKKFPHLSGARADELDTFCKEVKYFAFNLYYEGVMADNLSQDAVRRKIKKQFPFLNQDNLNRLDTQGMYYAHK